MGRDALTPFYVKIYTKIPNFFFLNSYIYLSYEIKIYMRIKSYSCFFHRQGHQHDPSWWLGRDALPTLHHPIRVCHREEDNAESWSAAERLFVGPRRQFLLWRGHRWTRQEIQGGLIYFFIQYCICFIFKLLFLIFRFWCFTWKDFWISLLSCLFQY